MAKPKNDVPPGGEDRGIFTPEGPDASAVPNPTPPAPEPPKTTRGMHHVLKACDKVWNELNNLTPEERRFVRLFVESQFPGEAT